MSVSEVPPCLLPHSFWFPGAGQVPAYGHPPVWVCAAHIPALYIAIVLRLCPAFPCISSVCSAVPYPFPHVCRASILKGVTLEWESLVPGPSLSTAGVAYALSQLWVCMLGP
jgi:hypothetical protein